MKTKESKTLRGWIESINYGAGIIYIMGGFVTYLLLRSII